MVVTDEVKPLNTYPAATMEAAKITNEGIFYGNLTNTQTSRPGWFNDPAYPKNPPTSINDYVAGLKNTNTTQKVGPNIILKVMAGDVIYSYADYYYAGTPAAPATNILSPLSTSLFNAISAGSVNTTIKGAGFTGTSFTTGGFSSFITTQPSYGASTAPRAYLNIIYLDEQFNYVGAADPIRVGTNTMDYIETPANLKCPQNGYAYVFLSNATENMFVYFDNFKVNHTRGRIVEENHYYPFGLKIAGISSNKLGSPENGHLQNRFGYQGTFAEEDEYTGWNEFELRNYDPQTGRWTGVDPYDEFASPYLGMGNNPISTIDPDGGLSASAWLGIGLFAGTGAYLIANNNINDNNKDRRHFQSALIGLGTAFLIAGGGYSAFESAGNSSNNVFNSSRFFANFRQFYKSLISPNSLVAVEDATGSLASIPNFGWLSINLNLNLNLSIFIPSIKIIAHPFKTREAESRTEEIPLNKRLVKDVGRQKYYDWDGSGEVNFMPRETRASFIFDDVLPGANARDSYKIDVSPSGSTSNLPDKTKIRININFKLNEFEVDKARLDYELRGINGDMSQYYKVFYDSYSGKFGGRIKYYKQVPRKKLELKWKKVKIFGKKKKKVNE